jgi:SpoVK/Ycf46/Vps4 family AAA+-type ATPase
MGIKPPKGVILYGVPGTGKTLLAKAVANQTSATFLRVVGSELIQKYLGDGPKLVRELFRVAEEHAPSIVFIDEIDAIGTKRYVPFSSLFRYLDVFIPVMIQHQGESVKSNEQCWNSSINWTGLTLVAMSRLLWPQIELTLSIPHLSGLDELTARLNFHYLM